MTFTEEKGNTLAESTGSNGNPFQNKTIANPSNCMIEIKKQNPTNNAFSLFSVAIAHSDLKKENLLRHFIEKNNNGEFVLTDPALFNRFTELSGDPVKSKHASRIIYLENQTELTPEEDRELELYANVELADYAKRIASLENKLEKTKQEETELQLLYKPGLRDRAARMAYLRHNENKTVLESLEYVWFNTPKLRPYAEHFMACLNDPKPDPTIRRQLALVDAANFDIVEDIAKLETTERELAEKKQFIKFLEMDEKLLAEKQNRPPRPLPKKQQYVASLDNLSQAGQEKLAKLYLKYICNIHFHSKEEIFQNYRSISFNPTGNCDERDRFFDVSSGREFATLRAVEDFFDQTATTISAAILKQNRALERELNQSLMDLPVNDREPMKEAVLNKMSQICKQKNVIMLALLQYHFDLAIKENIDANHHVHIGYKLGEITKTLVKQIQEGTLKIDTRSIEQAKASICTALKKEELENMMVLALEAPPKKAESIVSNLDEDRRHPYTRYKR